MLSVVTSVGLTHVATWQGFSAAQRRVFTAAFWQKQPLVVRGMLSVEELQDFCPLTPKDLLDLSCEPDAVSRLVRETGGASPWEVAHGPLDAGGLSELAGAPSGPLGGGAGADSGSLWTVLVNQVDRAVPEVEALREHVADFVPRWRIDDVMVSYAKAGCSIGAHVDNYDVFLLQVDAATCGVS
jgi:50S ribosomal protein L16 3-hydroxylase